MISINFYGDTPKDEVRELKELLADRTIPKSIYDDVAALQVAVEELSVDVDELHLIVNDRLIDTGWLLLPLAEDVSAQNNTTYPCRYRKIGKQVFVQGCVTGFAEVEKVIATLPVGFRPSAEFYYQGVAPAGKTDTFRFFKDGRIQRMATTTPSPAVSNYHFITTSFFVD